ncbi:unnamed protein product [Nyctereutes procyonoides]|uniref:(raccoon dog) hypothetical protein n=1 Tax=Nyctereutes procyonoides TaxID=34880 RepID=A0A811ZSI8_NYCPR|nr:unnamed protein product [Nyctereutes procyonoides]
MKVVSASVCWHWHPHIIVWKHGPQEFFITSLKSRWGKSYSKSLAGSTCCSNAPEQVSGIRCLSGDHPQKHIWGPLGVLGWWPHHSNLCLCLHTIILYLFLCLLFL